MDDPNELIALMKARREEQAPPAPIWLAKRTLAAEVRRIADRLCDSDASEATILAMAEKMAEHADVLGAAGSADGQPATTPSAVPGMETFFDRGPIAGRSNPISPPAALEVDFDARRIVGTVEFGKAFEGAPGCVHGGFVAAVLDEALGMACIFSGGPAMTGELTTRFLRHTPICTPLRVEARLDSVERKKVRTSGRVFTADGETLVESDGLFIAVGTEKFAALLEGR